MNSNNMACKWNPSLFQCSLLIEFSWILRILAMCGGTIFHRNIWSFSKCSENCKSIASNYNFFVSNALYVTNLLQVTQNVVVLLPMLCFDHLPGSPRPPSTPSCLCPHVRACTSCPRLNSVRALTSMPRDLTRLHAVCGSRPKLSAPILVAACARSCFDWRPTHFCRQPL